MVDLDVRSGVEVGRVDLPSVLFGVTVSGRLLLEPLSIVPLVFDLSGVTLRFEPLLSITPLLFDLSFTLREVVPLVLLIVPSDRRLFERLDTSLLRVAALVPVRIRPFASLLTLLELVADALLSVDLLLTLVSYRPRLFERTEE